MQEKNFLKYARLPRIPLWARIILISLLILGLLWTFLLVGLAIYISKNKDNLLPKITQGISEHISGKLEIKEIEPAFFKGFPNISLRLKALQLKDSLVYRHQLPLIRVQEVYVEFNVWSAFSKHPEIKKLTIAKGEINLFKLKNGYSNLYLLRGKEKKRNKSKKSLRIKNIDLEQITFTFYNFQYNKEFKIHFNDLRTWLDSKETKCDIRIKLNAFVHQLGFNLAKGGYLKDKELEGRLKLQYLPGSNQLKILKNKLDLDQIPVLLAGFFDFGKKPAVFYLDIQAKSIDFKKGIHMLTPNISRELEILSIEDPVSVRALLQGSFKYPDTPSVHVYVNVQDNALSTPFGRLEKVNFKSEFHNHIIPGKGKGDDNSAILIPKFTGNWQGIPISADSTYIYSLIHPQLKTQVSGRFDVKKLNSLTGRSLEFLSGTAQFDLTYNGPVVPEDILVKRQLDGYLKVTDAAFKYLPRNLDFKKGELRFDFKGEDVFWENIMISVGSTRLRLSGQALKFLNAYFNDPAKAVIEMSVKSRHINLNAFKSFLRSRHTSNISRPGKNDFKTINSKLDRVLKKSTMILSTEIDQVDYRNFQARDIRGKIILQEDEIELKNIKLAHAGGRFAMEAGIHQNETRNPFQIQAKIRGVEVDKLFKAFENFGQDAIQSTHLKGRFTADMQIAGQLEESGDIRERSINGLIHFKLQDGAILNFPPFVSISKFAFKKRNLDSVTFKTIQDKLEINRGKITIHPLRIESSAIIMNIQGVYALDKGTDIAIEIPLRNPQKEKLKKGQKDRSKKGLTLHLRAKDDDKGNVKVSWDPIRKNKDQDSLFSEKELQKIDSEIINLN